MLLCAGQFANIQSLIKERLIYFPRAMGVGIGSSIVVKDIGGKKSDFYVMLIVAAFTMWNLGVAFLVGIILDHSLRKGWIKV